MAPKGEKFELKTPKGTKDCKYALKECAGIQSGLFLDILVVCTGSLLICLQ
jgi:hypothetical protein